MTTAPDEELQVLIYSTLSADEAVSSLVDGVFDRVPASPFGSNEAYISFGPSSFTPDDADCIISGEHSFQIDVWSRKVGQVNCKKICSAIRDCLHEAELSLEENALVEIRLSLQRVMSDPDGLTTHGVMQFSIMIEEN